MVVQGGDQDWGGQVMGLQVALQGGEEERGASGSVAGQNEERRIEQMPQRDDAHAQMSPQTLERGPGAGVARSGSRGKFRDGTRRVGQGVRLQGGGHNGLGG